jgi:hypothetical protein
MCGSLDELMQLRDRFPGPSLDGPEFKTDPSHEIEDFNTRTVVHIYVRSGSFLRGADERT